MARDFNARVGTLADSDAHMPDRGCTDMEVNGQGCVLLELCKETGMLLCTGRVVGDLAAVPTFKARQNTQPTRPDHALVSADILARVRMLR